MSVASPPDCPISVESIQVSLEAASLAEAKATKTQLQGSALDWSTCPPAQHAVKRLPCANADVTKKTSCSKAGLKSCARCKLVSYCSKVSAEASSFASQAHRKTQECQTNHWKFHKLGIRSNACRRTSLSRIGRLQWIHAIEQVEAGMG